MSLGSGLRRPFVVRVQHDDPAVARTIARALVPMLRQRGARVLLDGEVQEPASVQEPSFSVHLVTGGRVLPGTTVSIGVQADGENPRWLAPLPVSEEPLTASDQVMGFLETWGFVPAAPVPASAALRASAS